MKSFLSLDLFLAVVLLGYSDHQIIPSTNAHGYMSKPVSRASTLGGWDKQSMGDRTHVEACGVPQRGFESAASLNWDVPGTVVTELKGGETYCFELTITANHKGYHLFHIADREDCPGEVSEECFYKHGYTLQLDPSHDMNESPYFKEMPERALMPNPSCGGSQPQRYCYHIPNIDCKQCMLRWFWYCAGDSSFPEFCNHSNFINAKVLHENQLPRGCAKKDLGSYAGTGLCTAGGEPQKWHEIPNDIQAWGTSQPNRYSNEQFKNCADITIVKNRNKPDSLYKKGVINSVEVSGENLIPPSDCTKWTCDSDSNSSSSTTSTTTTITTTTETITTTGTTELPSTLPDDDATKEEDTGEDDSEDAPDSDEACYLTTPGGECGKGDNPLYCHRESLCCTKYNHCWDKDSPYCKDSPFSKYDGKNCVNNKVVVS